MNFYSGIIILLTFQNFEEHLKEKRFYLLYTSYEYRCQNTKAIICIPLQRVYYFSQKLKSSKGNVFDTEKNMYVSNLNISIKQQNLLANSKGFLVDSTVDSNPSF